MPRVSVVMPAFNAEPFIGESIESILGQSWTDFELIVVNDCSTDGTAGVVTGFADPRIRLIGHAENLGPGAARNTGVLASSGEYVAFLDSDDLSNPTRLAEQVQALDMDDQLVFVGSWVETFFESGGRTGNTWKRLDDPDEAAIGLLFRNTMPSGGMVRKSALPEPPFRNLPRAEDYDFAVRLSRAGRIKNLPRPLVRYRIWHGSRSQTKKLPLPEVLRMIATEQLVELGISPTPRELEVNRHVGALTLQNSDSLLEEVNSWLLKLRSANRDVGRFDQGKFEKVAGQEWFEVCKHASELGWLAWKRYWASPLSGMWKPSIGDAAKFAVKCSIRYKRPGGDCPPLQ